jgi:hypothetical protein
MTKTRYLAPQAIIRYAINPMLQKSDAAKTRCCKNPMLQKPDAAITRCCNNPKCNKPICNHLICNHQLQNVPMSPSRCYMGAARLQWQVVKLHVCACRCPAAAAGSQTAVTVMQCQDTKLHAQMRTATLLQLSDRIPNCMHKCALQPCCSGRIPNCMCAWQFNKLLI